ncbi:hypothetical protein B0H16DRAFT_1517449 [Mycena metata]|uniref:Uncharacterized protein n=1 Tax=Mycena metata TaxID=1033252 RepID=A0AAD7NNV0_9AGAR|nr:hypothetical protein B0H16DRAFT_1517449 [Mycena metata]
MARNVKMNAQFTLNDPRQSPLPPHPFPPVTPASAVAARIFNDPQSWTRGKDDHLVVDMLQFPAVPTSSGPDSADFTQLTSRFQPAPRRSPESGLKPEWEGTKEQEKGNVEANSKGAVPFDTFNVALDQMKDVLAGTAAADLQRLSIMWAHRNLFQTLPSPLPSPLPPASPNRASATLPPDSAAFIGKRNVTNSATWSVLEYYGVALPETPAIAYGAALPETPAISDTRMLVRPPVRSSSRAEKIPAPPAVRPPLPPVPGVPATTPLKVKSKARSTSKTRPDKAALLRTIPTPPASRAPSPFAGAATEEGSSAPTPAPHKRATSAVRPLPMIPKKQEQPSVPVLAPPTEWTRPRAITTTSVRSLPRTPAQSNAQARGVGHTRSHTMPQPTRSGSASRKIQAAAPF